jgi:beta-glucosidase
MIKKIIIGTLLLMLMPAMTCISSGQSYDKDSKQKSASFNWPDGKKMAISLTFDDARLSQIDKGIPILDKYGITGTFYVSPNNMVQRIDGWKKAVKAGHDIGNHSLVHPCSGNFAWSRSRALEDYSLVSMKQELDSANITIKQLLGVDAVSFAYPCGQKFTGKGVNTRSYIPVVASMFESGRGWLDESANDPSYCDFAQLTGVELDGKSFDQVLKLIETAKASGQWLVLAGHEMDVEGVQTSRLETIEAICKYASDPANGIWIDNVHNVAKFVREKRNEKYSVLPLYKNPLYPVNQRVADLLGRMTLEEKIGQMNMPCVYEGPLGNSIEAKTEAVKKLSEGKFEGMPGPIGGFFTLANTILHQGTLQQANFFNELQKSAIEKTRLGIPLLQTEEGTHGLMCSGSTIFPEGLALGSTWNLDLINNVYTIAAREARSVGIHQIFTLVIEPNRDPRLGRNQEGYSEDPYFCSQMAKTIVNAVQGKDVSAKDKTVAGLCHYPGQSQPTSGLERGSMEYSERTMREVFLPSWEAGIKQSGALGVMATYPAIDRIPTHANSFILTKILREEFGFKGLVLSEGGGLSTISYMRLAKNDKETGELALKAGLDVGISYENGYIKPMIENVNEGKVSMELIDRAVIRILEQKYRLGLFENPYVDPANAVKVTHTKESQNISLEAAREGIVLLKNAKDLLPLKKDIKTIAVIGPNADNERNQLGDYTSKSVLQEIVTVLEGIKAKTGSKATVKYAKGCDVIGDINPDIAGAKKIAKESDVAIVVLGENEWNAPNKTGTDGEGYDVASLDLTGSQEELLKAVYETGTPTILVLINGRPLSIRWAAEKIPAIIEAWIPGELGGNAVADILFGDVNPSGKLTITVPRHSGQLPSYYNYMPEKEYWISEAWGKPYADMPPTPLWEFGYGLSYTKFEYSNIKITPSETGPYGNINVSVDVKNTGMREGKEVVQLYIRDLIATVTVPVKELKGFSKILLKPGEAKTVNFTLKHDDLALYDKNMNYVVEPGIFEVMVGSSSKDIRVKGNFEIK